MPTGPDAPASDNLLSLRTYFVILGGTFLWCASFALAPLLSSAGWNGPAELLYSFFHRVCHQIEGRSLHLAGEPLAVCGRCMAVYLGFLSGTAAFPLFGHGRTSRVPARGLLIVALGPLFLDVVLGLTGVHESSFVTRVISGSIAGAILSLFILPAAIGAVQQLAAARKHATITSTSEGLSDA